MNTKERLTFFKCLCEAAKPAMHFVQVNSSLKFFFGDFNLVLSFKFFLKKVI